MGQLFSVQQVAMAIGMNVKTVERWCRRGVLRAVRFGDRWRVTDEELERIRREGLPRSSD